MSNKTLNIVDKVIDSFQSKIADNNGKFQTGGFVQETAKGNLVAKSEDTRIVGFFNTQRRQFVAIGKDISTKDLAEKITEAQTLKDVFAQDLSDAQINQRAANVTKGLKVAFPEFIPADADTFKHAEILQILKAAAAFAVRVAQPAPAAKVKVIKAADVAAELNIPIEQARAVMMLGKMGPIEREQMLQLVVESGV